MDTTRRTILRGMVAAPVLATAGGLLVPESALAAQAEPPLTLAYDLDETSAHVRGIRWLTQNFGRFDAARISLAGAWGVTKVDPARVPSWPAASPKPAFVFGWSPNDPDASRPGSDWYPQGVTTYYDAMGRIRKRMMVSWHDTGARVAIIDRSGRDPRYHYAELVRAVKTVSGYAAEPISGLHAGGLAWYRNRLYVTDSQAGALLVFNTDEMFKHPDANKVKVTPYAMPLSRTYQADEASREKLAFSQVSVDRTSLQGPFRRTSLIVSSFARDDKPQHVGRWSFAYNSGSLLLSTGTTARSSAVYQINRGRGLPSGRGIQGAVAIRNSLYISVSNGSGEGLFSTAALNRDGVGTAELKWRVPRGPEDLSYEDRPGRGGWMWGLGEYVGNRHVYAMPV
ncbi:hypothetical protein [Streptomyces sp. NPDC057582]|uniref:hypothetical protein n=1 Tax=Streptomyces sp. NPDC057582 TaxID=3346174 RepID=UPI0036C37E53